MKTIIKSKRTGKILKEFEYPGGINEIILAGKITSNYIAKHYGKKIKLTIQAITEKEAGIIITIG